MKIKTRLLIALCALLPFIGQAITVECDLVGNVCDGGSGTTIGAVTRDEFYKVTLSAGETIDYFQNGWFLGSTNGWVSQGSDFIVIDASGSNKNWSIDTASVNEPYTNYVNHGLIATSIGNTDAILRWQGSSIGEGVYYFGYNTVQTNNFVTVGFLAGNDANTLNEDWTKAVGQGLGPIHVPIPEPASVLMLGLGGVLIGFFRRLYSHHA